jgi:hypothetical protein
MALLADVVSVFKSRSVSLNADVERQAGRVECGRTDALYYPRRDSAAPSLPFILHGRLDVPGLDPAFILE